VGESAWLPATPSDDIVTSGSDSVTGCVQLSSRHVERPTMKVDLGHRMDVSGVIVNGQKKHADNGIAKAFFRLTI